MKRKINNQISEAIPILHKILLMVENDEVSFTMFETKNGLQAKDVFIVKRAIMKNKVK